MQRRVKEAVSSLILFQGLCGKVPVVVGKVVFVERSMEASIMLPLQFFGGIVGQEL